MVELLMVMGWIAYLALSVASALVLWTNYGKVVQ